MTATEEVSNHNEIKKEDIKEIKALKINNIQNILRQGATAIDINSHFVLFIRSLPVKNVENKPCHCFFSHRTSPTMTHQKNRLGKNGLYKKRHYSTQNKFGTVLHFNCSSSYKNFLRRMCRRMFCTLRREPFATRFFSITCDILCTIVIKFFYSYIFFPLHPIHLITSFYSLYYSVSLNPFPLFHPLSLNFFHYLTPVP